MFLFLKEARRKGRFDFDYILGRHVASGQGLCKIVSSHEALPILWIGVFHCKEAQVFFFLFW